MSNAAARDQENFMFANEGTSRVASFSGGGVPTGRILQASSYTEAPGHVVLLHPHTRYAAGIVLHLLSTDYRYDGWPLLNQKGCAGGLRGLVNPS